MVGVQFAQSGVSKVSGMIAAQVVKKLPQQALTKGAIYPIVKKVAGLLGVTMTKKLFASGVAKAIPVIGAVLSGGLTLGTFLPMSKKLQRHLASLELTKPGHRTDEADNPENRTDEADNPVDQTDESDNPGNQTDEADNPGDQTDEPTTSTSRGLPRGEAEE